MECRLLWIRQLFVTVSLQLTSIELRCRTAVGDKERLEERIKELERERKTGEKKIAQLQTKVTKANTELKEEKEVSALAMCTIERSENINHVYKPAESASNVPYPCSRGTCSS